MADKSFVRMKSHARSKRTRASGLLRELQDWAQTGLSRYIHPMLDQADDALFNLAKQCSDHNTQQLYFAAMRDIRVKRKTIAADFVDALTGFFNSFAAGNRIEPSNVENEDERELTLLDDSDMEERVAISNMAGKALRNCGQELFALTQRLIALTGREDFDQDSHPLSPIAIASAIGCAVGSVNVNVQVKIIVYKLFDHAVMARLGEFYKELNARLVEKGVLPKIYHRVHRPPSTLARGPAGAAPGVPQAYAAHVGAPPELGGATVLPGTPTLAHIPGTPAYYVAESEDFIQALTTMQTDTDGLYAGPAQAPGEIGAQLLEVAHGLRVKGARAGFGGTPNNQHNTEQCINMVSMIFDYLMDDPNIPPPFKALLARLQIPVLKLALLDDQFLARKAHPARLLLNRIAEATLGWDGDTEDPLLAHVEQIIDRILNEYADDSTVFATCLQEFEEFLQREESHTQHFEQRTQKTTAGKERIEQNKRKVDTWIDMWTARRDIPDFVHHFLRNTWRHTLLVTMHQQGEDSKQWKRLVNTINNLFWSLSLKKSATDQKRLARILPTVIDGLEYGIDLASAHPNAVHNLLSDLENRYAELAKNYLLMEDGQGQSGTTAEQLTQFWHARKLRARADTQTLTALDRLEAPTDAAVPKAPQAPAFDQADALPCGTWLELRLDDARAIRAKLSWQSPVTGRCLLVNRKGVKIMEKTQAELAQDLRSGRARILESAAPMDRAIARASQ